MKNKIALMANIVFILATILASNTTLAKDKVKEAKDHQTTICHMLGKGKGNKGSIVITVATKSVGKHLQNHGDAVDFIEFDDGSCAEVVEAVPLCGYFDSFLFTALVGNYNLNYVPTTGELVSVMGEPRILTGTVTYGFGNDGLFVDGNSITYTIDETGVDFVGESEGSTATSTTFDNFPVSTLALNAGACAF